MRYFLPFRPNNTDILLNVFLAIAVDNLADADSLTTIEKEGEEAPAEEGGEGENNEGDNQDEEGKLSRHASRRSRRRSAAVNEELDEEDEERLQRTWSKRSRADSKHDEDKEDGEEKENNFDEGKNFCTFGMQTTRLSVGMNIS